MTHFQVAGEFHLGVWRILITTLAISGFRSTNLSHFQVQKEESSPYATAVRMRNDNLTLLMEVLIFGGNNRALPSTDVRE